MSVDLGSSLLLNTRRGYLSWGGGAILNSNIITAPEISVVPPLTFLVCFCWLQAGWFWMDANSCDPRGQRSRVTPVQRMSYSWRLETYSQKRTGVWPNGKKRWLKTRTRSLWDGYLAKPQQILCSPALERSIWIKAGHRDLFRVPSQMQVPYLRPNL